MSEKDVLKCNIDAGRVVKTLPVFKLVAFRGVGAKQYLDTLIEHGEKYLRMVPEGGNWKSLPKEVVPAAMGGAYESGGGKVGFYRRLTYSQPSPTITTAPAQKATMLCHPIKDRPLSIHEYARIQQFPEDWKFAGTTAEKYKQIGNAVPVGLAKAIGEAVIAVADKNAVVETKRFRGTGIHNRIKNALELGSCSGE